MAVSETPAAKIERLLQAGDPAAALRVCDELLAKLPSSPVAHLGRARALMMLGRPIEGERALDRALAVAPKEAVANTIRANLDAAYGRDAEAIERLRPFALAPTAQANEALLVLLDILYHSGRRDEWRELLDRPGPWRQDLRAMVHQARVLAEKDPAAGVERLRAILRGGNSPAIRRLAGFEGAALLDKSGDYRGAYELARETHATTGEDFDIDRHLRPVAEQLARVEAGVNWIAPKVPRVEGVVMISALPRSGTTLLEQMLDRHPAISGIGEYAATWEISSALKSQPAWPRRPQDISADAYLALQRLYLEGAARNRRAGAQWTFDKSLRTWQSLPEIAAVLPGAACIDVQRDPRDLATSLFLSHFQIGQQGWTLNLESIRRTIDLQQKLTPRLLEILEIPHVSIAYEELVENPARDARRSLALLGLDMDERVLSPEVNARAAMTLSVGQVRRPINRSSIGRWKNYAFAFDASWDAVVAEHESRRAKARALA
jgi:tetratricopeptide (TPR) repeat protein